MNQVAKHIVFTGRVQGVGFRFTAYHTANRYELTCQVRNLADGSVEIIAQGRPDDIADCLRDLKAGFSVSETHITEVSLKPQYTEFKITF